MEGLIVDEQVIVEIVRPGSGDPVPEGEVGEVVVTVFNPDYPLVRFATGDLSATLAGTSPCGRTNMRIKGWMGRADQATKVRGMFVHPSQVHDVARRHSEVGRVRLVVDRDGVNDVMTLRCECATPGDDLVNAMVDSIREICKLRGAVELVAPGTLPNDGKVIDDVRKYE
jgi:phenylacetate-CoA ligase